MSNMDGEKMVYTAMLIPPSPKEGKDHFDSSILTVKNSTQPK